MAKAWSGHTPRQYYLSRHPYKRLLNKGLRIVGETFVAAAAKDREHVLKKTIEKRLFPPSREKPRKGAYALGGVLSGAAIIILFFWTGSAFRDHSHEVKTMIEGHQDGNDLFAVMYRKELKNLEPPSEVMFFSNKDELHRILAERANSGRDIHLIVEDNHLHHVQQILKAVLFKTVQTVSVGGSRYHLLTAETPYPDREAGAGY